MFNFFSFNLKLVLPVDDVRVMSKFFCHMYKLKHKCKLHGNTFSLLKLFAITCLSPFNCYVTQMGGGCQIFRKKALRRCVVQRY